MDMPPQSRTPLIIAIALLLLPVLYVGSYLALVAPNHDDPFAVPYRVQSSRVESFYWPLEQIDRKLRPGDWEPLWVDH